MAQELLSMIECKNIAEYRYEFRNDANDHYFNPVVRLGLMEKRREFTSYLHVVTVHCHCKMPKLSGEMLRCKLCTLLFHCHCYLVKEELASKINTNFLCYNCRLQDSSPFFGDIIEPDTDAISKASNSILEILPSRLTCMYPLVDYGDPNFVEKISDIHQLYNL